MSSPQSHVVSVIESASEGDLIQRFATIDLFNLTHLPLVEVITLPHLDAVKDVVASIDHSFTSFVFKRTAWVHLYADASNQMGG